jgi:hypothetical protein
MKQDLLRELEWLEGLVQCVTGSMTSLFFNTGVTLATTSSIRIVPGVCPKVEHMEGYFFSPFFITFLFNSSTPSFSFLIFSFFQSYLRTSNSNLLELSLGRSLRLWRIIGRFFLTLVTLYLHESYYCHETFDWKSLKVFMNINTFLLTLWEFLFLLKDSPFTCAHEFFKKFTHARGVCTYELIHFHWTWPIRDTLTSLVRLAWNYYPSWSSPKKVSRYGTFLLRQILFETRLRG